MKGGGEREESGDGGESLKRAMRSWRKVSKGRECGSKEEQNTEIGEERKEL